MDDGNYLLNNSTSSEAKDPETINEAYINFKQTIGTFDTLVSCRDYSNYLKNYLSDLNERLVSNVQVTDVRTDPEYSKEIKSRDSYGNTYYIHQLANESDNKSLNLVLHGLTPINTTINSNTIYNSTYYPLSDSDLSNINANSDLDSVKTLIHNFVLPDSNTLNYIEARYKLQCNVVLKSNLSSSEQLEVLQNIRQTLYTNYNSTKVDFGEELPYDTLIEVIKSADTRIKTINLATPEISYFAKIKGKTDYIDLSSYNDNSANYLTQLIGDNILAGRLPLYAEDNSFTYNYDMDLSTDSSLTKVDYLACMKAELTIPAVTDTPYTLKTNEGVELIQDSYITQITYPAYIYYTFVKSGATTTENKIIPANTVYKIKANETLYIQYTDSSDIVRYITYTEGDIIKPNFDIYNLQNKAKIEDSTTSVENIVASKFVDWDKKTVNKDLTYTAYNKNPKQYENITPLFAIGTNEQIDILKLNSVTLPKNTKCFWYIKPKVKLNEDKLIPENETNNILFSKINEGDSNYTYILEEGEYFIYPTDDMLSLNILGSGTKLIYTGETINRLNSNEIIDLSTLESSIADSDVGTFEKSFSWNELPNALTIVETSVSTFIEGDTVEKCPKLNSSWKSIKADELVIKDTDLTISEQTSPLVRTLLSITCSADAPQIVKQGQTIYYSKADSASETVAPEEGGYRAVSLTEGKTIQISPSVDIYNDLGDLQSPQYEQVGSKLIYRTDTTGNNLHDFSYKLIEYTTNSTSTTNTDSTSTIQQFISEIKAKATINSRNEYVISKSAVDDVFGTGDWKLTCNIDETYGLTISIFDSHNTKTQLVNCTSSGEIDLTSFKYADSASYLYISLPKKLSIYSYLDEVNKEEAIVKYIRNYDSFDPLGDANSYKMITSYTPLYSYLDKNNIYNKLTISKIDFANSTFNIMGGTRTW